MTTLQLLIVCLTVLALAAMLLSLLEARLTSAPAAPSSEPALDLPLETDVVLHLRAGTSLRGRVIAAGTDIRLADVRALDGGHEIPAGGTARVRAAEVRWSQVL